MPIRREAINILFITAGVLSAGMGLKGFLFSSHFIDGGVTGISMLLAKVTPLPLSIWLPLVNLPFVALGYRQQELDPTKGVVLLAESGDGERAALLVEAIQDQRQVVIKSLEANYRQVPGVAAATILGDGRVALILDIDTIVAVSRGETRKAG